MKRESKQGVWSLGVAAGAAMLILGLSAAATAEEAKTQAQKDAEAATHLDKFGTFVPAFTEEAMDFAKCQQFVNGQSAPADLWRVRRTFGLVPGAGNNWKDHQLEMPAGAEGKDTTFGFLFVLKQPVEVGTLSVTPADYQEPAGSVNGGELFYVTGDAKEVPDVTKEEAWTKAKLAAPAPLLRFCTLPKGTMIKAIYYKDVRKAGAEQLVYLNAYKQRLMDVTAAAKGSCTPKVDAKDPATLTQGKTWSVEFKTEPLSDKTPATYTLTWGKKQPLVGIFFYSNADKFRFLDDQGKEIKFTSDWDNMHGWEGWHFNYRWLSFPKLETTSLTVEITACDGKTPWISGLGSITMAE